MSIEPYLEDLEQRLDEGTEERLFKEWEEFVGGRFKGGIFRPRRGRTAPPGIPWPNVRVNETLDDFEKMALQQFAACSEALERGSGRLLAVRANYGTSIIPSLFGAKLFIMPDEADTLPTSWPLAADRIKQAIEEGPPDLRRSLGGKVLEMTERFADIQARYPRIGRWVRQYHPDFQGPADLCEVLWGSALFIDLVDHPDLVKTFLTLITDTYIRFMRAWAELVPFSDGAEVHWGMLHRGHIMLRDDSAMNLSPAMFDEFVRPYDQRLLDEFGGGAIHFCGRGHHFIPSMCTLDGLHAIAMSQPEMNDMEVIYRNTVDKGIQLIGFSREAAKLVEADLARGRDLRGCVHAW